MSAPDFVQSGFAAVVLAAGEARRMGMNQPKVLLPWHPGATILDHILHQLTESGVIDRVIVVTGAYHEAVRAAAKQNRAEVAHNPDYAAGEMLSSLMVGLRALLPASAVTGALVVLGDQPSLTPEIVRAVGTAFAAGRGGIIAPRYNGQRGHPILFGRAYWAAILDLPGNAAPRRVIDAHPDAVHYIEAESDAILRDVDTPEAYAEERRRAGLPKSFIDAGHPP